MASRAFELEQDLIVDGNSFFNGTGTVQGNFQVFGNLQVSGSLVYEQQGTSDFIPVSSGYFLGNTSLRWGGNFADINVSGTSTFTGAAFFRASTTGGASFRVPHGTAPTTPANGDFWSTTGGAFLHVGAATKQLAFIDSSITGDANNAAFLGGSAAATYRSATNLTSGTLPAARLSGAYTISVTGNADTATLATTALTANLATTALTANNSTNLNGQAATYYLDLTNATGTIASARLTGTYAISISGAANNSTNFAGQAASYYLDLTNATGTLPSARLTGTYAISVSGNAATATSATSATAALTANNSTNFNGQAAPYYLDLTNSTGTLPTARLTGTYGISISGNAATATSATSATSATTASTATNSTNFDGQAASFYTNIPARLGFTPVQEATGVGQTAATIKIGWSAGSRLKATVNTTDLGNIVFDSDLAGVSVGAAVTANNATFLNGQAASYYNNAANLTGTVASARLTGTYAISISGTAADSTLFGGQAASYYLNASNITSGTLDAARIPASMAGKTFTSDVAVSGTITATTATTTNISASGSATLPYATFFSSFGGTTGGAIRLGKAPSGSSLTGDSVYVLQVGNLLQIFEAGGSTRGINIDLAACAATAGSSVWHSSNFNPANYLGVSATAANASALAGQAGSYYLDATNINAGTLSSARLTGTYGISISGNAATATSATSATNSTQLNGQAAAYYLDVGNATGTLASARLTGTYAISISGNAATATSATSATSATTATNSTQLNGQAAAYYLDLTNATGTIASARLTGTYGISISGNAATAASATSATNSTQLNGQAAAYYLDLTNATGTLADARLPGTMAGKTFSSAVAVTGALTVTGDITAFSSSDRRLKMDIVPIASALDKVRAISGYTYTRIDTGKREAGIIAQEIQAVLPEVVVEREHGVLAVDYPKLVALLIEAIKEMDDNATK